MAGASHTVHIGGWPLLAEPALMNFRGAVIGRWQIPNLQMRGGAER
jgi:hypothetical protein